MSIKDEHLSKLAVKNSVYSIGVVIASKLGGFFLTIILARLLLPELFGVYSLVFSITMIAVTFTDLGADLTAMRFMSKALAENNEKKARSYFRYILKMKAMFALIAIVIILIIAEPLANVVFNKPLIFIPLVSACLFLFIEPIRSFFSMPFSAKKDLKILPSLEFIFQVSRVVLVFLAIYFFSYNLKVSGAFLALALSGLFSLSLIFFTLKRKYPKLIFGPTIEIDKKRIMKFMGYMAITGVSLIIFGSIDTLMLGHFVDASYLGYYRAAFVLVSAIAALLPFSGLLLPMFTQIGGKRLNRGFQKSLKYLLIFSIPMAIGLILISRYLIFTFYGNAYLPAALVLSYLSLLIIISPLISLYSTIFQAKEKPKLLANTAIMSLLMNIVLNYILIKLFLNISQEYAIIGAGIATLASNIFFLAVLMLKTKKNFNIGLEKKLILKSIFSTIVMAIFLIVFMNIVKINILSGVLMVTLGAFVYFLVLFLIKGFGKEDIDLLKLIIKKEEQ